MFKNATIYKVSNLPITSVYLEREFAKSIHLPCSPSQERSEGWVPPRGDEHGALIESINGELIASYVIETKAVPGDAIRKRADEKAAEIERTTGRKPGKKAMRDLRDDVKAELLPHAFPKRKEALVWIDSESGRLVIDTASPGVADAVVTSLVRAMPGDFRVAPLQTDKSPQVFMTNWLVGESSPPGDLYLNRACELLGSGDEPVRIKFSCHDLDTTEVRQHVKRGALPVSLALSNGDVDFTLTHQLQLRKIVLAGDLNDASVEPADSFDADVALATSELRFLIDVLVDAMGWEPT